MNSHLSEDQPRLVLALKRQKGKLTGVKLKFEYLLGEVRGATREGPMSWSMFRDRHVSYETASRSMYADLSEGCISVRENEVLYVSGLTSDTTSTITFSFIREPVMVLAGVDLFSQWGRDE